MVCLYFDEFAMDAAGYKVRPSEGVVSKSQLVSELSVVTSAAAREPGVDHGLVCARLQISLYEKDDYGLCVLFPHPFH
jgi:hypothetical protein